MTRLGELDLQDAAAEAAGNWKSFDCFCWFRKDEIDDAKNWAVIYTHHRDSGLLDQSNAAVIAKAMQPFTEGDDPDVVFESHHHWAVGHIDGFSVRVFRNGEVTEAFKAYHELAEQLADYPILDEEDYSSREFDATFENIGEAAWRLKHDFNLPDEWQSETTLSKAPTIKVAIRKKPIWKPHSKPSVTSQRRNTRLVAKPNTTVRSDRSDAHHSTGYENMSQTEPLITSLNHVVGQKRAVTVLRTALDAYWNDRSKLGEGQAFPHLLMCGPGGTGKTLLSELIARELCTECHVELAQNIGNIGQVQGLLMMLEPGHILLIDEIHELSESSQVCLYRALEERKLFLGGNRKPVTLPPFTLVGATTDEYLLTTSMRDRFRILLRLTHYSDDEIALLIQQRAGRLGWEIGKQSVMELAKRSRGVPRLAVRFLESAKRVCSAKAADIIAPEHVAQMLKMEGIDKLGFDPVEQRYLQLLKQHQGPVRLNVLSTHLGLPRQTIEMFERDFIRLGLITKTDKGRALTPAGIEHLNA